MPELIEISGFGKAARKSKSKKAKKAKSKAKRPVAKKRKTKKKVAALKVGFKEVNKTQMKRTAQTIKKASIKKAVNGLRRSIKMLSNAKWAPAAVAAYGAALQAAAAHKKDPHMATRIIVGARNVIRYSVKRMKKKNV